MGDVKMIASALLVVAPAIRDLGARCGARLETLLVGAGTALMALLLDVVVDAPFSYACLPLFRLDARVRRFAAGQRFARLSFTFVFLSAAWLLMPSGAGASVPARSRPRPHRRDVPEA